LKNPLRLKHRCLREPVHLWIASTQKGVILRVSVHPKESFCKRLTLRTSPFTLYGFMDVAFTAVLDMPGHVIETLDPVSRMRLLATPISTEIEGIPCSNKTKLGNLDSILSGVEGVPVFAHTSFAFCWFLVSFWKPCLVPNGVYFRRNLSALNGQLDFFFLTSRRDSPLFSDLYDIP